MFDVIIIMTILIPVVTIFVLLCGLFDKTMRDGLGTFTLCAWALWALCFHIASIIDERVEVSHFTYRDVVLDDQGQATVVDDDRAYLLNSKSKEYFVDYNKHYSIGSKVEIKYYHPISYMGVSYQCKPSLKLVEGS